MVEPKAAQPAKLLAAAGPAGAAMDAHGHDDAVAGLRFADALIHHQHPAVIGTKPKRCLGGEGLVGGEHRRRERTAAPPGEIVGLLSVAVRHEGADRAEGLDLMDGAGVLRVVTAEQCRRHERGDFRVGVDGLKVAVAGDYLGLFLESPDGAEHRLLLGLVDDRSHGDGLVPRVPGDGLGEAGIKGAGDVVHERRGNQGPADRRAFLARLLGHLARHFTHEEVELGGALLGVGTEEAGIQTVGLDVEADGGGDHAWVGAERIRRLGRAGEGDGVGPGDVLRQPAGGTADEGKRARRQHAGLDHVPHHPIGEQRRRRRRLGQHRHPGKQRHGGLFPETP